MSKVKNPISAQKNIFISIGLTDLPTSRDEIKRLLDLMNRLQTMFSYIEVLLVSPAVSHMGEILQETLKTTPCVRLLRTSFVTTMYQNRSILAEEALGDVTVVTNFSEIFLLNFSEIIEQVLEKNAVAITTYPKSWGGDKILQSIGRVSGFYISARYGYTLVLPRTSLNILLIQSEKELSLRFPPRLIGLDIIEYSLPEKVKMRRPKALLQRLGLLYQISVNTAPSLLRAASFFACMVALISFLYACYAVGVYFLKDDIQTGWLTISLVSSLSTFFLSVMLLAIAMALQKLLRLCESGGAPLLLDELSKNDLFMNDIDKINVTKAF